MTGPDRDSRRGAGTPFEAATTTGLEHVGRTAIAIWTVLDAIRTPHPMIVDPPDRWRGLGPVVLVGGFAATAPVLAPMAGRLERLGWDVVAVTTGSGLGCAGRSIDALAHQLRVVADRAGGPLRVVGHSRGGQIARVAARRAVADGVDVAALVTLGSPFDLYGLRWPLLAQVATLSLAGSLGAPGLASLRCLRGPCCAEFRAELRAPWPAGVPFTSIRGRYDEAVPARSSIDVNAVNVEVRAGHVGLLTATSAFGAVADALSRPLVHATVAT